VISRNVRALRALLAPGVGFMAVVKADAYGHGAEAVARTALSAGANRIGVATAEEAIALRAGGVRAPIQLLGQPPISAIHELLEHAIIPAVTTFEFASSLARIAGARGVEALCHLKVDTGMNRIGIRHDEAPLFAREMADLPGLSIEGVFTHFATADVPGDWDFGLQVDRFEEAVAGIRSEGVDPGIVHAANSPAAILSPRTHLSMVRCGLAMYGLHPCEATREVVNLTPAMSVKARITLKKRINIGDGVSYGLTWRAAEPSDLVTLPLGYADGVHRAASNTMEVLIGGKRCQQVGRVCMDQLMVVLPRGNSAKVGDEAVLVGSQGAERIEIDELAQAAGTINYELACAFGMRLPRRTA
ncbi:MAG: alanine racemase, partial [Actinobacteria bacterium]|nr:alanine racemase [Actinomycetota bacterium]